MNAHTKELHNQGVSLWLDNITRKMLDEGVLTKYIKDLSVTGLTSNPSIFEAAIAKSSDYDSAILELSKEGLSDEEIFFRLAVADIQRAADEFLPTYEKTNGLDGFVSIEVSPLLAYDTENTIKAAKSIHKMVDRPNAFIKIPGTPEGLPAIEQAIAAGIPINITLLFSPEQYEAAAMAYLRGVETRIEKGLNPDVRSVASVFVSRWDRAITEKVPASLHNKLGLAIMTKTYDTYLQFLKSDNVRKIMNEGAFAQRILWASTGTKDPEISDITYIKNLVAAYSVNTMPEKTLLAFADHGETGEPMTDDTTAADELIKEFAGHGVDYKELAETLQKEGAESFNASWNNLIASIASKKNQL